MENAIENLQILRKLLKIDYKGQLLLKGSIDHFRHTDLFLVLTLLYIIAVYSLSLSIIIFKITKNSKISSKLPIQGQQPNNRLSDSSDHPGQIDRDLINKFTSCQICSKCFGF